MTVDSLATGSADDVLVGLFSDPAVRSDPYPSYRRLRETAPVHHSAILPLWVVSRYDDCAEVLRDNRFGKERRGATHLWVFQRRASRRSDHLAIFDVAHEPARSHPYAITGGARVHPPTGDRTSTSDHRNGRGDPRSDGRGRRGRHHGCARLSIAGQGDRRASRSPRTRTANSSVGSFATRLARSNRWLPPTRSLEPSGRVRS